MTSKVTFHYINDNTVGKKVKNIIISIKQGRKRPLDTPKRMIERRKERERKVKGEI